MSGKYGDLIQKARKPESKKAGKPDAKEKVAEAVPEKQVNLSIKVPESWRRHWVSEAKREGSSLTAAITEALTERFGRPED